MLEKFIIPPEIGNKFTKKRIKEMEEEAEKGIENEKIRSGELMPADDEPQPDTFKKIYSVPDNQKKLKIGKPKFGLVARLEEKAKDEVWKKKKLKELEEINKRKDYQ